jgi:hypothetical protein
MWPFKKIIPNEPVAIIGEHVSYAGLILMSDYEQEFSELIWKASKKVAIARGSFCISEEDIKLVCNKLIKDVKLFVEEMDSF